MSKFKVGDKVRFIESCGKIKPGDIKTIKSIDADQYNFTDGEFCGKSHTGFELSTKSLDNLAVDDVVVDDEGREYTVGSVHDSIIDLVDDNGHFDSTWTVKQLKDSDYTVKQDEPEVTELTMDEIATKFGVPVEQLKVKK